jgi:Flp pilus assembly pilin Flp
VSLVTRVHRDERGMTAAEVVVASALMLVVLIMASSTVYIATTTTRHSIKQGTSLSPALLATQEVEQILSSAWTPVNGVPGITNDCTGNSSGGAFASGNGPFVAGGAGTAEITFCSLNLGSATAYTYDLYLKPTSGAKPCTTVGGCSGLELDQWPAPACSPCTTITKSFIPGINYESVAAFSYYFGSGSSLTSTSTLSQIQVVKVYLTAPANTSSGPSTNMPGTGVQRYVVLSNTLSGMS